MNKTIQLICLMTTLLTANQVFAEALTFGDAKTDAGALNVSGAIRGAYLYKDYAEQANEGTKNGTIKFLDTKVILNYENPNWLASMDARCYQYDRLCDAIYIRDAWVGYKLSENSRISAGQQDIEFGFGRLWGNTNYGSIFSATGLEDVQNIGLKYNLNQQDYHFTLGYYPVDGANYKGLSKDSSRYGVNYVEADELDQGTHLEEKNMWVTRLSKTFQIDPDQGFNTEIGASYWHSDLDNKITGKSGNRDAYNIFATTNYNQWQWLVLVGEQKGDNADQLFPHDSTMGSRDFSYQVANDGKYLLNEINYTIKQPFKHVPEMKSYLSYGKYYKDQQGYLDSERLNAGVYFFYKDIGIQAEYIISKNDPAVGSSANSLAKGDNNDINKLFALAVGYFF